MNIVSITRRGLGRQINEDRLIAKRFDTKGVLIAVADGMGGHRAGEEAARIVLEVLESFTPSEPQVGTHLVNLVLQAHRQISEESARDDDRRGMGTTVTAAYIENGTAHWVHVGDSRLYLVRDGEIVQVTEDHTLPGLLLKQGEITRAAVMTHPFRNILLSCVGRGEFELDAGTLEIQEGDLLLLSTDGLHDTLREEEILSTLKLEADLNERVSILIRAAQAGGGQDDVTVVAAQV